MQLAQSGYASVHQYLFLFADFLYVSLYTVSWLQESISRPFIKASCFVLHSL